MLVCKEERLLSNTSCNPQWWNRETKTWSQWFCHL